MAFFKTCPRCGASLDPDEKCDCKEVHPPIVGISVTGLLDIHKKLINTNMANIERSTTND